MNKRAIYFLLVAFVLFAAPGQVLAHHGSSNYDSSKTISVKGTVTEFLFINPHSVIHLESKGDKGNTEQWFVEADSPNNLARAGWKRDSVKPGDLITIEGIRAKDGSKVMFLRRVVFSDGRELKAREGDQ